MSLPIILAGSGVDLKGDVHGSAQVSLLDASGNPIRKTSRLSAFELGNNPYDVAENLGTILDITPVADAGYTSAAIPMTVDGFDVITVVVHGSGSGTKAFQIGVEGSTDGSNWHNAHPLYMVAPQAGQERGGIIEFRSAWPYVRVKLQMESAAQGVPSNISVHAIRSLKSLANAATHPVSLSSYGPAFDAINPHSRGIYTVEYVLQANTTAGYVYIALFNPATSKAKVSLKSVSVTTQNTSNNGIGTLRSLNMVAIGSISGGTPASPGYFRSVQPLPFSVMYSGNPTIVAGPVIYSFSMEAMSYGTLQQQQAFPPGLDPQLNPGEGWALVPSVALTTNDRIHLRAVFHEEV